MMHRTIVVFSTLAIAASKDIIFPKGSCTDDEATSKTCCTVDENTNPGCTTHVNWAMGEGFTQHENWYTLYGVKRESDFADFQCSLFWISWNKAHLKREEGFDTPHHGCPRPCQTTILDDCAEPPSSVDSNFDVATQSNKVAINFKQAENCPEATPAENCACGTDKKMVCETDAPNCAEADKTCPETECKKECPSSLSPLIIALLVLLALALLAAVVYFLFFGQKEKTKKKKRALKPAEPRAEPPAAPATVQPQSFTMAPIRTTAVIQAPPVYSGIVTTAPPTTATMVHSPSLFDAFDRNGDGVISRAEMASMMQPVQTTAVPMVQYAAPAPQPVQYAVAQPQMMQYAAPAYQQQVSLFDALDRNHDGVISRNEFR